MEKFEFNNTTKIIFGKGQIEQLGSNIKLFGGKKVLLVYGKGSIKKNGVYSAVVDELKKANIDYVELPGVDPNPKLSSVKRGAEICKKGSADFVLAVGGGSSIDCAKGIAVAAKYDGDPWDFYCYKTSPKEALPIGTVLTIAATGSEMDSGSVITNEETNQKIGWGNPLLNPKFSILDPTYTYTVSKHQTACGIVDILTHVYEYYFNCNKKAALTDGISETIMRTAIEFGLIAYNDPTNYEARANLMWASSLALNGITTLGKDFDGFNHITEHALSGIYDITHADGLSILGPNWMEYVLNDDTVDKLAGFAKNVWHIEIEDPYAAAKAAIKKTREFYDKLNMPSRLSQVGIDLSRVDEVLKNIFIYQDTIGQFAQLTPDDVRNILSNSL